MNIPGYFHYPPLDGRWDTPGPPARFLRFAVVAGFGLALAACVWIALVFVLLAWLPRTL